MSQTTTGFQPATLPVIAPRPAFRRQLLDAALARLRAVPLLRSIKRRLVEFLRGSEDIIYRQSEVAQKNLIASWKQLQASGVILPLDQVGFSRFSEFEEDGHLLYLLTLAGSKSRAVVEISSQDGRVCMATNLLVHHRWRGFLFDGDPVFVREGQRFFASHAATRSAPPVMKAEWFTRENVNQTLAAAGVPDEVDVLSLDIDGNDLYLWSAMKMRPRNPDLRIQQCGAKRSRPHHSLPVRFLVYQLARRAGDVPLRQSGRLHRGRSPQGLSSRRYECAWI